MARDFPGTSGNYLSLGNVLNITGTLLTIHVWAQLDTAAARRAMVDKRDVSGQYQLDLVGASTPKLEMRVSDSGGDDTAQGATTVTTGVWHACAGRKNGTGAGSLQVFLDGVSDASVTSAKSIQSTTNPLCFGAQAGTSNFFDGRLAEVAIWDVALSDAEIAALAKGMSPVFFRRDHLKGYWPVGFLVQPGQTFDADFSGNVNNAQLIGTVVTANHAPVGRMVPMPTP
jgi:Concanavalin A-like lectin/glucanases superfamily